MQKLLTQSLARCPEWIRLPTYDREYRHLVVWSYTLMVRVRLLAWLVALSAPFATIGSVRVMNRWLDAVGTDIAELRRRMRALPRR